jgi:hypothetical protein
MNDPDGMLSHSLQICGVKKVQVLAPLPPPDWVQYAGQYYWEAVGFTGECPAPHLSLGATDARCDIIIHAGSGSLKKNWPLEYFLELADNSRSRGMRIGWTAGPAELEHELPLPAAERLPEMPLVELGHVLAGARLYVGNDSGITHLAAAVGCPTVAIFGPTNPTVWAPRGTRVKVVQGNPWPTVADVMAAGQALL